MWKVATTVLAEVDSSLYHWEDKEATRGSLVYRIYVRSEETCSRCASWPLELPVEMSLGDVAVVNGVMDGLMASPATCAGAASFPREEKHRRFHVP